MAKVKEIRIGMSRKISDDNYGSMGVQGEIFLILEDDDDKDEMWAYGTSWLSAKLTGTHKAHGTLASQPEKTHGAVKPVFKKDAVAKPAPVAQDAQQPSLPADGVVAGELTFPVETLSVDIKGGKRYMKAKGGHFTMYGVNVWKEVAALPPLEWDLEALDGADYPAPTGLTAIYSEKTIVKDDGTEKVVPDKVTAWK